MSLLGLPPELKRLILSAAMPDGFESLMLSCSSVHEAGKPLLERHNSLRRGYRLVVIDEDLYSTIPLLLRIAHDPLIAEYVEDIDFWNAAQRTPSVELMSDATIHSTNWAENLRPLILRTARTYAPGVSPDAWISELAAGIQADQTGCLGFVTLLLVLHNLRCLTPTPHWEYGLPSVQPTAELSTIEWKLMDALVTRAHDATEVAQPDRKLTLVRPCFQAMYGPGMALQTLSPLMAVPTVKTMSLAACKAVDDGYTGRPFKWHYPLFGSNIERLELAYCCVDGPSIGEVVQHMPRLRILRYSHEKEWHGCPHDWDAGEFIAHVGKWCGAFLQELSVIGPEFVADSGGAAQFLKQFAVLKDLELHPRSLESHGSATDGTGMPAAPALEPTVPLSVDEPTHLLVDILPSSLERLRLVTSATIRDYDFLHGLLSRLQPEQLQPFRSFKHIELSRTRTPSNPEYVEDEDPRWVELGKMIPSSVNYSCTLVDDPEPAWHSRFFEQYPEVKEHFDFMDRED